MIRQSQNQYYSPPYNPYGQQQGGVPFQQQQMPGGQQPMVTYQPPGMGGGPGGGPGTFSGGQGGIPSGGGGLPVEQSYVENILRLNLGKLATVYATFENNREWNAKVFKGIIEAAGRDHLILSDPQTGMRYLILMVYVDYVTFDEEIEYSYPFGSGQGAGLSTVPPR
ncbi:spore coat protein GerQ [Peribacillus sp. SCS-26]|uniref:spore coat protein GerQ n=1 Tax=Paraperibacillus marinus TaxID=3115295 RepID=UPI00390673A7